MCVIVVKPAGVKLKKAYWEECFKTNGHGAGLCYIDKNNLIVDKGYFKFEPLYKEIERLEERELIVHFRISSAGSIVSENCHPFFFQSHNFAKYSFALVHNGTLDYRSTKDESDTNLWSKEVLFPMLDMIPWFADSHAGKWFLRSACKPLNPHGNQSKLVLMVYDKEKKESKIHIINKGLGVEDMGCWFSNHSYRLPVVHHVPRNWMHDDLGFDEKVEERFLGRGGFMHDKDWSRYGFHQDASGKWISNRFRSKETKVSQPKELPPGVSVLPSKEEQQKLNAALVPSVTTGTKEIVVPRDEDKKAAKAKEIRFNSRLEHLSKRGRKILRRKANDLAKHDKEMGGKKLTLIELAEFIQIYRDLVRCKMDDPDVIFMSDMVLDRYICDRHNEGETDLIGLDNVDATPSEDEIEEAIAGNANLGGNVERFPGLHGVMDQGHGDPLLPQGQD